jgi:hypothetical protein
MMPGRNAIIFAMQSSAVSWIAPLREADPELRFPEVESSTRWPAS